MADHKLFGLAGRNISYSFSKKYFEQKFTKLFLSNHSYKVFDIKNESELPNVLKTPGLVGLNVTIPYKEKIIQYLDELSPEARATGAVNTVKVDNGKTTGFNTDIYGFDKTLQIHLKPEEQNSALILGDGGAAKAVQYALQQRGIPFQTVSRKGSVNFENLDSAMVAQHNLIIQCTPVGTFPDTESALPFPFEALGKQHLVVDLIYNPAYSQFLKKAAQQTARTVNGLYMLEQQAEKAWEIWNFQ